MNGRRILFSILVSAIIGAALGYAVAQVKPYRYSYHTPQSSPIPKVAFGAVLGGLAGAALESVSELKKEQDREEKLRSYLHTFLSLQDIEQQCDK